MIQSEAPSYFGYSLFIFIFFDAAQSVFVVSEAVQSSRYVNDNWPLTLVYFSSNVGGKLTTGQFLVDADKQLQHSVTRCLRDFWYESGFDWYGD